MNNQQNLIRRTSKMCAKRASVELNIRPQRAFSLTSEISILSIVHRQTQNSLIPSFVGINCANLASCKAPFPSWSLFRQKSVTSPSIFLSNKSTLRSPSPILKIYIPIDSTSLTDYISEKFSVARASFAP